MLPIINVIAPVLAIIAAGALWARRGMPFDQEGTTKLILYLGAPALAFAALSEVDLPPDAIGAAAGGYAIALAVFLILGWGFLRLWGKPVRWFLPALCFPNNANLGLPILLFAYGESGLSLGVVIMTVTVSVHFSLGISLVAGRWSLLPALQQPALWGVAAGLGVMIGGIEVPQAILRTAGLIGDIAIPLALFSLGHSLSALRLSDTAEAVGMALGRVGLGLAGAGAGIWLLDLEGVAAGAVLLQSIMPAAVFNYMFTDLYGGPSSRIAGVILASTALSLGTVAILLIYLL